MFLSRALNVALSISNKVPFNKYLTINLDDKIKILNKFTANEIYYITESFDESILHFKFQALVDAMEKNARRTNVDRDVDINYVIKVLTN